MRNHQPHPDHFLRAAEAARAVEKITGERPHAGSIHRWASRGLRGVKLRTIYAMGARRTTEAWLREFFEAVAGAEGAEQTKPQIPASRLAAIQEAERALDADGISTPGDRSARPKKLRRRVKRNRPQ